MSTLFIVIQTLVIAATIQLFVRKQSGLALAFWVPGLIFIAEVLYLYYPAQHVIQYQHQIQILGKPPIFFTPNLFWAIPVCMLGLAAGRLVWWARDSIKKTKTAEE